MKVQASIKVQKIPKVAKKDDPLKKKKNKKFRKKITKCELPTTGTNEEDFKKLFEETLLPDGIVSYCNVELNHTLGSFLKTGIPKWKKQLKEHTEKNSPIILVISGSAVRCCQLNQEANNYKGENCKTGKLFAKHLKLKDQAAKLKKDKIDFAVGTPARVLELCEQGHLNLSHTKLVVIDYNWRNVKLKRIVDIKEVKEPLMKFVTKHVIPAFVNHEKAKIALY